MLGAGLARHRRHRDRLDRVAVGHDPVALQLGAVAVSQVRRALGRLGITAAVAANGIVQVINESEICRTGEWN
ncbi:hypothetical protein GCM10010483_08730 [Actinokineospora diospyrosa]